MIASRTSLCLTATFLFASAVFANPQEGGAGYTNNNNNGAGTYNGAGEGGPGPALQPCMTTCINQVVDNVQSGCTASDYGCICSNSAFQPCVQQQCGGQNVLQSYCNGGLNQGNDENNGNGDNNNDDGNDGDGENNDGNSEGENGAGNGEGQGATPTSVWNEPGTASNQYGGIPTTMTWSSQPPWMTSSSIFSQSTASVASVSRASASASAAHHNAAGKTIAAPLFSGAGAAAAVVVGALGVVAGGFLVI